MRFGQSRRVIFTERVKGSVAFVYTEATVCFCAESSQKLVFSLSLLKEHRLAFASVKGFLPPTKRDCGGALLFFCIAIIIKRFFSLKWPLRP